MDEVVIAAYDPSWPQIFAGEAQAIRQALGGVLVGIEHVGSTSVPGFAARPVIDIQVVVQALPKAQGAAPLLAELGYEQGVFARDPERRLLFKKFNADGILSHHLHVYEPGHPALSEHILFRDYLRLHPDEAQRYLELKHKLAQQYQYERVAYSHAKTVYIEAVLAKARGHMPKATE
jgi:GrpB-like predicted nucleotidyltransferase (UPF0157 family)